MVFASLSSHLIRAAHGSSEEGTSAASTLARLSQDPSIAALPENFQRELQSLNSESNSELFVENLFALAQRLENAEHAAAAGVIFSTIAAAPPPHPPSGDPLPRGERDLDRIRNRAEEHLNAIGGTGSSWARAEFLGRHLAREASDPAAIGGMLGAGLVYRATRLAALSGLAATPSPGLATRLLGARRVASLIGFMAEAPAFTAATRLGNAVLGREQEWSAAALGTELASGAIVLGCLKVSGALFGALGRRMMRPGGAPARAPLPVLFNQAGMFTGILAGHRIEEMLGLRPHLDGATTLTDSLATLIQFNVGGRLAHQVSGSRIRTWEMEMDRRAGYLDGAQMEGAAGRLLRRFAPRNDIMGRIGDVLTAPMWMAMGAGGIGGGGPRRPSGRSRIRVPFSCEPVDSGETPHSRLIRHLLEDIPDGQKFDFDDVTYSVMEVYSREAGLPFEIFLGRALREAPPALAQFWIEYLFDPQISFDRFATDPLDWIQSHHIHAAVPWVRSQLTHPEARNRLSALQVLHHFMRNHAIDDLLGLLGDQNLEVRLAAQAALIQEGIPVALPRDHAIIAVERSEEFLENLPDQIAAGERPVDETPADVLPAMELGSPQELMAFAQSRRNHHRLRSLAIEVLAERNIQEAVPLLRSLLYERPLQEAALLALDTIRPDWDASYRPLGQDLLKIIGEEWTRRFPSSPLSEASSASMRRALEAVGSGNSSNWSRTLVALLATGAGLATFFDAPTVFASASMTHAADPSLWWLAGSSLFGAAAAVVANRPRHELSSIHGRPTVILEKNRSGGSRPPLPPRRPGDPLGYFEDFFQTSRSFPVHDTPTHTVFVGRATPSVPGVFPHEFGEFRHISRRHMEMRERDGRVEVRTHEETPGLRINQHTLVPRQWYELNDGDFVEFVSFARPDLLVRPKTEDQVELPLHLWRMGEPAPSVDLGNLPPNDQPALFRFRRSAVITADAATEVSRPNWLENAFASLAEKFGRRSETPPPPVPPPESPLRMPSASDETPRPALRTPQEIATELERFHDVVRAATNILEPGLRLRADPTILRETMQSLLSFHQRLCGGSARKTALIWRETRRGPASYQWAFVSNWDGELARRVAYYERAIAALAPEFGTDPAWLALREQISHTADRLNRLSEIVNMYRTRFEDPEPEYEDRTPTPPEARRNRLAILDSMIRAYHGLRRERATPQPRPRSDTLGLESEISAAQRGQYIQNYLAERPPSRAVINMRILFGEQATVRGREVVGDFYRALGSGTGQRIVQAVYDRQSGQIVAFYDGNRTTFRAVAQMLEEGREFQVVEIVVDALRSGRIIDVTGIPETENESVRLGLEFLRGLQVVPETDSYPPPRPATHTVPEVVLWERSSITREIHGNTELGQTGERWTVLLHPPHTTNPAYLRRVEAVTPFPPSAGPDGRPRLTLLTLEGYRPFGADSELDSRPGEGSLQLWIPSEAVDGLSAGDVVAITQSPGESI